MWIVKGEYCGCPAIWGAYSDKETADEVARRVNGTVEPWKNDEK
jgi:hypothetical protein